MQHFRFYITAPDSLVKSKVIASNIAQLLIKAPCSDLVSTCKLIFYFVLHKAYAYIFIVIYNI